MTQEILHIDWSQAFKSHGHLEGGGLRISKTDYGPSWPPSIQRSHDHNNLPGLIMNRDLTPFSRTIKFDDLLEGAIR